MKLPAIFSLIDPVAMLGGPQGVINLLESVRPKLMAEASIPLEIREDAARLFDKIKLWQATRKD